MEVDVAEKRWTVDGGAFYGLTERRQDEFYSKVDDLCRKTGAKLRVVRSLLSVELIVRVERRKS